MCPVLERLLCAGPWTLRGPRWEAQSSVLGPQLCFWPAPGTGKPAAQQVLSTCWECDSGKGEGTAGGGISTPHSGSAKVTPFLFPSTPPPKSTLQGTAVWSMNHRDAPTCSWRSPTKSPHPQPGPPATSPRQSLCPKLLGHYCVKIHFLNDRFGLNYILPPISRLHSFSGPANRSQNA